MSEENFTYSEWPFFSCSRVRRTFARKPNFEISSGRRPREISKGSQANVLLTSEQEKKEVTNVCRWNFFHKNRDNYTNRLLFLIFGVFLCNWPKKSPEISKNDFFLHYSERKIFLHSFSLTVVKKKIKIVLEGSSCF